VECPLQDHASCGLLAASLENLAPMVLCIMTTPMAAGGRLYLNWRFLFVRHGEDKKPFPQSQRYSMVHACDTRSDVNVEKLNLRYAIT
jgi:hypothetical protein